MPIIQHNSSGKVREILISQTLKWRGHSYASIARDLTVTRQTVRLVAAGKTVSHRIQHALAEKTGIPFIDLWGTENAK